jgi:hypothetical protein
MLALGSVLAGIGVLLVALMALLFRHPRAPRWTSSEITAMLLAVPVTGLIGYGFGQAARGGLRLLAGEEPAIELLAPLAVIALLAVLILPIRRRIKVYAATGAGPASLSLVPEITPSPDRPPRSPAPSRPTRRAA